MTLKRTPLYAAHQKLGGKLIEFGGWEMPVQYTSITDEHLAVRQAGGIFDISHMGEVFVGGAGAEAFLNQTLTNDVRKLAPGQGQYTLMCNEAGGVVDDLYVYRMNATDFLLIINASRIETDVPWLEKANAGRAELRDMSGELAAVAVQGPAVAKFIDAALPGGACGGTEVHKISELKKNQIGIFIFDYATLYVARTGYTGEDGFEIVAPAEKIEAVWNRLLEAGRPFGLKPAGLGARDTLRTEMGYPLYGHELDETTTPIEADLNWTISKRRRTEGGFPGDAIIRGQIADGPARRRVGILPEGRAPAREGAEIQDPTGKPIGRITSGGFGPSADRPVAMGYVDAAAAIVGAPVNLIVRGKPLSAHVAKMPFVPHRYAKP